MRLLPLICLALLLTGCLPPQGGRDALSLWRHRDQFVRLEAQGGPASDHPVALEEAQLRRSLAALRVRHEGRPAAPLFADNELEVLGAAARGLSAAEPHQDVTFAVVGMHRGSFALERRLTSGRLFFRDGALNLLLDAVHAPYDEGEDRRLHPLSTGSRTEPAPATWAVEEREGIAFAGERRDWLLLDLDALGAPEGELALHGRLAPPADGGTVAERLRLLLQLHGEGLISDEEYARKKEQILDSI